MELESTWIWIAIGVVLGALAGSVIHTVSLRLPARLGVIGLPVCRACREPMSWAGLIPFVPGRCESCGEQTNWHKPVTELAAAVIVGLALIGHGVTLEGVGIALFSLVLLQVLRIDWQHHLIYTVVIVPGSLLALALAALESSSELLSALIAAVVAAVVFALFYALAIVIYRKRALGRGDILLAFLIGAMARLDLVVPALLLGMLLAALGGLFLILIRVRTRHDFIPYGAYLCTGAMVVLLWP